MNSFSHPSVVRSFPFYMAVRIKQRKEKEDVAHLKSGLTLMQFGMRLLYLRFLYMKRAQIRFLKRPSC